LLYILENTHLILNLYNPMMIPLSMTDPLLEGHDPAFLNVSLENNQKFELQLCSRTVISFNVLGITTGMCSFKSFSYKFFGKIPVKVHLDTLITISVVPSQPKLDAQWELPSMAFVSQVHRVPVKLTNVGAIDMPQISLTLEPEAPIAGQRSSSPIQVSLDEDHHWPSCLKAGESTHVIVWIQWNTPIVNLLWQYGIHHQTDTLNVNLVPLVDDKFAQAFGDRVTVGFTTLNQTICGRFFSSIHQPTPEFLVSPGQSVLQLLQPYPESEKKGSNPDLAISEIANVSRLPPLFFSSAMQANAVEPTVMCLWTLNDWAGILPIPVHTAASISASYMESPPRASQYNAIKFRVRIRNTTAFTASINIEFRSDASLLVSGPISAKISVNARNSTEFEFTCVALVPGLHDASSCMQVSYHFLPQSNAMEFFPSTEVSTLQIEPQYFHASVDAMPIEDMIQPLAL
jgi:hypothetical protein